MKIVLNVNSRRYVPELSTLPTKYIHEPWLAPLAIQKASNCIVGQDYPKRLCDHIERRKICLDRLKDVSEQMKGTTPATFKNEPEELVEWPCTGLIMQSGTSMPPLFKLCFPFPLYLPIPVAGQILSTKRQFAVTPVEHFVVGLQIEKLLGKQWLGCNVLEICIFLNSVHGHSSFSLKENVIPMLSRPSEFCLSSFASQASFQAEDLP